MKYISSLIASAFLVCGIAQAQEDASSMDQLLQQIERGQARASADAREREARFAERVVRC